MIVIILTVWLASCATLGKIWAEIDTGRKEKSSDTARSKD